MARKSICSVCGNDIDLDDIRFQSTYDNDIYWFDSKECKDLFDVGPADYISAKVTPLKGESRKAGQEVKKTGEEVIGKAKSRAKSLFADRKADAADMAGTVSEALRNTSKNLKNRKKDNAARFVDDTADQADRLSGYFRDKDVDQIIDEAEDMVRSRPGLMIGGALAAGFVLARFLKSESPESRHGK